MSDSTTPYAPPPAAPPAPPAPPMAGPGPEQPPPKKPPIALIIVLVVVVVCGLCTCVGIGIATLVPSNTGGGGSTGGSTGSSGSSTSSSSKDQQVIDGAQAIARGCEAYAADNGSSPPSDQAWVDGDLGKYVDSWPDNPFTGEPMAPTGKPGDYIYHTATSMGDGQEYLGYIEAVLESGETEWVEYQY